MGSVKWSRAGPWGGAKPEVRPKMGVSFLFSLPFYLLALTWGWTQGRTTQCGGKNSEKSPAFKTREPERNLCELKSGEILFLSLPSPLLSSPSSAPKGWFHLELHCTAGAQALKTSRENPSFWSGELGKGITTTFYWGWPQPCRMAQAATTMRTLSF